jgi:SAM-dependent MidA family methyltransferase
VTEPLLWRTAMTDALYGTDGFFTRPQGPGGSGAHFRTSVHASALFAMAVLRLVVTADEALGRPNPFEVVDIGAGAGHLLRRLAALAPTHLASRLRLSAVEVAPRPGDLPGSIAWSDRPPAPRSVTGVVLATEWLDNVPLDIAEIDEQTVPRYVRVDPRTGTETLDAALDTADEEWARRWWAERPWQPGSRVELGASRDQAWAGAVRGLARGLAVTVDYGHMWYARPVFGTLTGFYAGRVTPAVPDGSRDITAHVAVDAACAAGEAEAGEPAILVTQREALAALGVDGTRPPIELATKDPTAYVRALSAASQAAELTDGDGLGGHYWIVQPVRVPAEAVPASLRAHLPVTGHAAGPVTGQPSG